jgi:hypothetical protein
LLLGLLAPDAASSLRESWRTHPYVASTARRRLTLDQALAHPWLAVAVAAHDAAAQARQRTLLQAEPEAAAGSPPASAATRGKGTGGPALTW